MATGNNTSLPSPIDPAAAIDALRKQREPLLALIRQCLPTLANSLLAKNIIPSNECERACNPTLDSSERGVALLDCVESRVDAIPSDFAKVVDIIQGDPYLESIAEELVKSYVAGTHSTAPDSPPLCTPPAISQYRTHLKSVYENFPISCDAKWPPTPSRAFISLALVKSSDYTCRDHDYIGHVLEGNVAAILQKRDEISIENILEAEEGKERPRLVLVEGAPGIGKSTLAWELCRKWEEFPCMQQYSLVILLRMREEKVQQIASINQLFEENENLAKEVSESHGRDILFILDGFDELPKQLQEKGFLLNLIKGEVLPKSTVLVTSRPSATADLLTSCGPGIQKRVEILGFTEESVQAYASSIEPFQSDPGKLAGFKAYISASNNPAINSLMYIPLNAAIVVHSTILPHTLTELYTQLCLTVLNRYLKIHHPSTSLEAAKSPSISLEAAKRFEGLPPDLYQQFLHLSEMAFEGFQNEKVIFHAVSSDLVHFGFLDAVSALSGFGKVSYNFLHLTTQEFFVAYHISCLRDNGLELLRQYGKNQRWNVVWRFVAGLTEFRAYGAHMDSDLFISQSYRPPIPTRPVRKTQTQPRPGYIHEGTLYSLFFFQCLFESQTADHFLCALRSSTTTGLARYRTPTSLDAYAVGYCIANFPMVNGISWDITLHGTGHLSFAHGLNSKKPSVGVVKNFSIENAFQDSEREVIKQLPAVPVMIAICDSGYTATT